MNRAGKSKINTNLHVLRLPCSVILGRLGTQVVPKLSKSLPDFRPDKCRRSGRPASSPSRVYAERGTPDYILAGGGGGDVVT